MDTSEGMSSRCLDLLDQSVLRDLDEAAVARDERLQRVALGAWLRYQMQTEGFGPSPLDLHPKHSSPLPLPPLCWSNYGLEPSLIKVTNTGSTVTVNARWDSERPYLLGGPFRGRYVFSQIHFHWGPDNGGGAEHSLMGESFPLEMHVAHYKAAYENQERALREADGIAIIGYLFKLNAEDNTELNPILRALPHVKEPRTSDDLPLVSLARLGVREFEDDYFFYYGSVEVSEQQCPVMWIIWPNPLRISSSQVCQFREIFSRTGEVHAKNFRTPRPAEDGKNVHFVYGGPIIPDLSKAGRRNRRRSKRNSRREHSFPLVDNEKKETG